MLHKFHVLKKWGGSNFGSRDELKKNLNLQLAKAFKGYGLAKASL
jgi:hypothetical protein